MALIYSFGSGSVIGSPVYGTSESGDTSNLRKAQTLKQTSGDYSITDVQLQLLHYGGVGTAAGDLGIEFRATSPSGTLLASASLDRTSVTIKAYYNFTLDVPVSISSGTVYCVVLADPSGHYDDVLSTTDDLTHWYGQFAAPPAGHVFYYDNDSIDWTVVAPDFYSLGNLYGNPAAPAKAITPDPADSAVAGADFSDWTLGWADGGGATSYQVYLGDSPVTLNLVTTTSGTSHTIPVGSPFRNYLFYRPAYWRVDSVNVTGTTTGDVWTFDPRPAKPATPTPADSAIAITLDQGFTWT